MAIKFSFEDRLNPREYGERHIVGFDEGVAAAPRHGAVVRHKDASPAAFAEAKAKIVESFAQWTGGAGKDGGTLAGSAPAVDDASFDAVVAAPVPSLADLKKAAKGGK